MTSEEDEQQEALVRELSMKREAIYAVAQQTGSDAAVIATLYSAMEYARRTDVIIDISKTLDHALKDYNKASESKLNAFNRCIAMVTNGYGGLPESIRKTLTSLRKFLDDNSGPPTAKVKR